MIGTVLAIGFIAAFIYWGLADNPRKELKLFWVWFIPMIFILILYLSR